MKKILLVILLLIGLFGIQGTIQALEVVCTGLPGDTNCFTETTDTIDIDGTPFLKFIGNIIKNGIMYVAVVAVLALIVSGVMYMLSIGDDEKTSKAKKMIIYSLVGVLLSTSAWTIVNLLNVFKI